MFSIRLPGEMHRGFVRAWALCPPVVWFTLAVLHSTTLAAEPTRPNIT